MTTTTSINVPHKTPTPMSGKVAAAASLVFAFCFFWTVASVNVPHDATDAELLTWWQESDNRLSGTVSCFFAIGAAVAFAVVVGHVRRLPGFVASPAWSTFARSMGAAFTATLLVSAALRGVISHQVDHLDQPLPSIDVLRYSTALNYILIGVPVMAALALTIVAISVVTLRTAALRRWTAYVGLGVSALILAAVSVQMGAYAIALSLLWAFCLSIALARQTTTTYNSERG